MKRRSEAVLGVTAALVVVAGLFVSELTSDTATFADRPGRRGLSRDLRHSGLARWAGLLRGERQGSRIASSRQLARRSRRGSTLWRPLTSRTVHWPNPPGDDLVTRGTDPGEAAYWCAPGGAGTGHLMTAFNTHGYSHLDFTPKQTFTDVRTVCWDQNVTHLGNRKWTQVTIVPKAMHDAVAPRLDYTNPDLRIDGPAFWGLSLQ